MNKIDDFFKNRLDVNASEDDGWNIPSDDLWNAAKPHFPKEKKKRSFLWIWMSLGFVLVSVIAIWYSVDANDQSLDSKVAIEAVVDQRKEKELVVTEEYVTDVNEVVVESDESINNVKSDNEVKQVLVNENANSKAIIEQELHFKTNHKNSISLNKDVAVTNNEDNESLIVEATVIVNNTISKSNDSLLAQIENNSNNKEDFSDTTQGELIEKAGLISIGDRPILTDVKLLKGKIAYAIVNNESEPLANKELAFIQPKVVVRPKEEIGISSHLFFVSLLNGKNVGETPERVVFNGRYRNLNLKYSKWIGRKWSVSTGLLYADLAVNLDFDTNLEYNEDDFEELVETEYGELINKKYDPNSNKLISLKPGVELINGDLVNARGKVDLGLRVLQVPIILNYHWYTRKVELYTGLGIGLEAIWGREQNIDFKLFQNGTLISDPVNQEDASQNYFDYSVYSKLGTKFNINRNVNLDVNLSLLILEPIFSGIEIGMHYRWHK